LAARFVSGYIFIPGSITDSAPGIVADAIPGAEAPGGGIILGGGSTHAWMQVYLPGAGWIDFDPTNSIIGNRHLIRVAVAWGPQQMLPLWGTFSGPASAFIGMDVAVSVTESDVGKSGLGK
jgi:transglutaminase-like putative cysteine protease